MATVVDLARYADVSAENVVRVLQGRPVSTEVTERVERAIDALGRPTREERQETDAASQLARAREELLRMLDRSGEDGRGTAPPPEPPEGSTASMLVQAVRGEVQPVSTEMARLALLFDWIGEGIRELKESGRTERVERIEDLELMVELLTTGWKTVDRRLGRVELALQRIEAKLDRRL